MNSCITSFKNVLCVRSIPDDYAAGLLAMLAYKHHCIYNLLYHKTTNAPYVAIYTNDPVILINEINEHKAFKEYREVFAMLIEKNRHFIPERKIIYLIDEDDDLEDMDESPF